MYSSLSNWLTRVHLVKALDLSSPVFKGIAFLVLSGISSGAWAQCFLPYTNFSTGSRPYAVAVGDFNRDAKLDIVTTNTGDNTLSVLLGDGNGRFGTHTDFGLGNNFPYSVAVGDFNGDTKLDLVVANGNTNSVSILLGDGLGRFGTPANFATGKSPNSVAVSDFNGDTKLDLVVANYADNSVSILLGDGLGGFGVHTDFYVGPNPFSVAIGDFNGDNKADLVTALFGLNGISVLLGTGTGSFGKYILSAADTNPTSVAVGDFNGDAKLDVAVANLNSGGQSLSVSLGNGKGQFGDVSFFSVDGGPISVAVSDFNRDGKLDLVTANSRNNSVSLLPGDGTGKYKIKTDFAAGHSLYALAVGDFNGDGKPDVVTTSGNDNAVSVLINCPIPTLILTTSADPNPVCANTSTKLSAIALNGTPPYSYTWAAPVGITLSATSTSAVSAYVGAAVSGTQTLTITAAAADNTPISTSLVSLTVKALASATLTGAQTIQEGKSATLTVAFTGDGPWRFSYKDSTASTVPVVRTMQATTNPYSFFVNPAKTTAYYLISVGNGCGDNSQVGASVVVVVSPLLAVEDVSLLDALQTYPVPAAATLTVRITGLLATQSAQLELVDVSGKTVYQQETRREMVVVNVDHQPSGVYLLRVRVGERIATKRIVKL